MNCMNFYSVFPKNRVPSILWLFPRLSKETLPDISETPTLPGVLVNKLCVFGFS